MGLPILKTKPRTDKRKRGQGMTEYIIIVALIAIASIAVITLFGNNIRQLFGASANALAGQTAATNGASAASNSVAKRNISNFNGNIDNY